MKRWLLSLVFVVSSLPAMALTEPEIAIVNETGTDIVEVYAKCSDSSRWGDSILNGIIRPRGSVVVDTSESVNYRRCNRIDILVEFRNGATRERSHININTLRRWTVTP